MLMFSEDTVGVLSQHQDEQNRGSQVGRNHEIKPFKQTEAPYTVRCCY